MLARHMEVFINWGSFWGPDHRRVSIIFVWDADDRFASCGRTFFSGLHQEPLLQWYVGASRPLSVHRRMVTLHRAYAVTRRLLKTTNYILYTILYVI